ncbi:hypothetical protein PGJ_00020190 [Porphyromonas gingivalis AJW4]|nr:hypothetical protein PGJ_00020190 [Porphyromonas gingivalis AJW4]ALO28858.1 hypothetical protein PGS_00000700 [Porphyromonas gingivalis A7A1-28]ERJ67470.1 hypothetical protein HMPREF1553_01420 [Porphyromonas gingivalis F0568]ERJ88223.1 hypothetical protein HMPREF1990_01472 [Porphyromonas gingivalis W4087]
MVQFGLYNGNLFGRIVVRPDEKGLPIRKNHHTIIFSLNSAFIKGIIWNDSKFLLVVENFWHIKTLMHADLVCHKKEHRNRSPGAP